MANRSLFVFFIFFPLRGGVRRLVENSTNLIFFEPFPKPIFVISKIWNLAGSNDCLSEEGVYYVALHTGGYDVKTITVH